MADGLNACLDLYPEWPPGAAQFRAACLGVLLGGDGKEIANRAGMYSLEPPESVKARQNLRLEGGEVRHKRKIAAEKAINEMRGLFDED